MSSDPCSKESFLNDCVKDYVDLSEDNFWMLAKYFSAQNGLLGRLAKRILRRDILPNYLISNGKEAIVEEVLKSAKLKKDTDYKITPLKSTLYKESSKGDNVFVVGNDGDVNEVSQHSFLINSFKDKPETETVLIVLDESRNDELKKLLKKVDAAKLPKG